MARHIISSFHGRDYNFFLSSLCNILQLDKVKRKLHLKGSIATGLKRIFGRNLN